MRPGYLGDADFTGQQASSQIRSFQKQSKSHKRAKDFSVWSSMYADPLAKRLYQDPYSLARADLIRDPGAKAVVEVKKATDKLVETKKAQAQVSKESAKAAKEGNMAKAAELKKVEGKIAEKAKAVEGQLATRVSEGVALAKAKRVEEKAKDEVAVKKQIQAKKYPHLTNVWAKHDALYDRNRAQLVQKHNLQSLKDAQLEEYLKTLPSGAEKQAKLERHKKQAAARRVTQAQEVAKFDSAEAGRVDAREKTAK